MFLAFFPFSEVIYVLAGLLAWIYIVFGFFGSHEATVAKIHSSEITIQQSQLTVKDSSNYDESTCYWVKSMQNNFIDIINEIVNTSFFFKNCTVYKFIEIPDFLKYSCPRNILSNRAPPFTA